MRRRDLIKSIGFAVVSGPLAAQAQPAQLRRRRLGVLLIGTPDSRTAQTAAYTRWLEELSWKTAVNLDLEYRWATGDERHLRDQAADIVSLSPDVILVESAAGLSAMRQATPSIPIVFIMVGDPVCGSPGDTLDEVREVMTKNHVRYLPVTEEGRLLGVISFHDIAKAVIK